MSPAMGPDLYVDYKSDFSLAMLWPLKATNNSIPSFFRSPGLLSQNSCSHPTMSSVIHPFSLHLNTLQLVFFFLAEDSLYNNQWCQFPPVSQTESITLSVFYVLFSRCLLLLILLHKKNLGLICVTHFSWDIIMFMM